MSENNIEEENKPIKIDIKKKLFRIGILFLVFVILVILIYIIIKLFKKKKFYNKILPLSTISDKSSIELINNSINNQISDSNNISLSYFDDKIVARGINDIDNYYYFNNKYDNRTFLQDSNGILYKNVSKF